MSQLPIGGTLARRLISVNLIDSVVVASPGSKRGVRLVSQLSLDSYLRSLLPKRSEEASAYWVDLKQTLSYGCRVAGD